MDAVYFVASSEDAPEAIYFSAEDAFESAFLFLDFFDENGDNVVSYKLIDEDDFIQHSSEENYTASF